MYIFPGDSFGWNGGEEKRVWGRERGNECRGRRRRAAKGWDAGDQQVMAIQHMGVRGE